MFRKTLKNQDGMALAVVILVMLLMTIFVSIILQVSLSETRLVARNHQNTQAYYSARAGVDALASYIIVNPDSVSDLIIKTSVTPATGNISGNPFKVRVLYLDSNTIQINSTGSVVNGDSSVNVSLTLNKIINPAFNNAFFSDIAPVLGNNCEIIGDVGTNESHIIYGNNGKNIVDGIITLGPDATEDEIAVAEAHSTSAEPVLKLQSKVVFPPIDKSKFTVLINSSNPEVSLLKDQKLYARADNVKDLGDITIYWPLDGNAELHLLVTNPNFTIGNNIEVPDGSTLFLYYNGTNKMTGNGIFGMKHLVIYAPNAIFEIKGGGNGTFIGRMIVKSATFPNSNAQIYNDASVNAADILGAITYSRGIWSK